MCVYSVSAQRKETKRNCWPFFLTFHSLLLSLLTSDKPVPHMPEALWSFPLLSLYPTYRHSHAALKGLLVALYLSVESAETSVRRSTIPSTLSVPCDVTILLLFPCSLVINWDSDIKRKWITPSPIWCFTWTEAK